MLSSSPINSCRMCHAPLSTIALDLGAQPISNRLPRTQAESQTAERFPLAVAVCESCGLPQLSHNLDATAHFHDDYTYLSGTSATWQRHCKSYAEDIVNQYQLGTNDLVVEAGSNDGTLLKEFMALGSPVLGVEPSANIARIAKDNGINTLNCFFDGNCGQEIHKRFGTPKAFIGNNVLAHVPDTHAFLESAGRLIGNNGFLCFEFPHFVNILTSRYFDTIYHEHYTYLGVGPLWHWGMKHNMKIVNISPQPTHGGSLRVVMTHESSTYTAISLDTQAEFQIERDLFGLPSWLSLEQWLQHWRDDMRRQLGQFRRKGMKVAGFAAASKATVLCNFLGISAEDIHYCCDSSPLKQGRFIPGTGIPIMAPSHLSNDPPDVIVVFAWNIYEEIAAVISRLIPGPVLLLRPLPDLEISRINP